MQSYILFCRFCSAPAHLHLSIGQLHPLEKERAKTKYTQFSDRCLYFVFNILRPTHWDLSNSKSLLSSILSKIERLKGVKYYLECYLIDSNYFSAMT